MKDIIFIIIAIAGLCGGAVLIADVISEEIILLIQRVPGRQTG